MRRNWEKRNIDFILDDYIDTIPNFREEITETTTRNGKTIKADLVVCVILKLATSSAIHFYAPIQVSTRGQKPNTELIAESFGKDTLTSQRLVKVEPTLQLPGHKDIFVIGDVIDWKEQKQALKALAHADIAVANLISQLEGRRHSKKYTGSTELLFLSNGRVSLVSILAP